MTNIRNKQRPFRLLKYLYENTDENHAVSTPELVRIFQAEDAHANRKTIKDDIDVLIGEGFDIVTARSRNHSFFLGARRFELPEIRLLIDAVSAAKFITPEKSVALIGKLTGMVSKIQAEKVRRHIYSADHVRSYCRSVGIGGYRIEYEMNLQERMNDGRACALCGAELVQPHTGRHKRFCSDSCRRTYWRMHRAELKKKESSIYTMECPYCHGIFEAYGNKNRKYCCHEHYDLDRFGPKEMNAVPETGATN